MYTDEKLFSTTATCLYWAQNSMQSNPNPNLALEPQKELQLQ